MMTEGNGAFLITGGSNGEARIVASALSMRSVMFHGSALKKGAFAAKA